MFWGTLGELRDGLGDPRGCSGRVGGILGEVRNGLRYTRRGPKRDGGPSGRSETIRWTLEEV